MAADITNHNKHKELLKQVIDQFGKVRLDFAPIVSIPIFLCEVLESTKL